MARLCVQILPNNNPNDPPLDLLTVQAGDVVCIMADGHVFSDIELRCGQYRIIDVPGVHPNDIEALILPVLDAQKNLVRLRAKTLDLTALRNGAWRTRTSATKTQIDAITLSKA